jgi:hypothetical protein
MSTLSEKEEIVLKLYEKGLSTVTIGVELEMAQSTAYHILRRVERKLNRVIIRNKLRHDAATVAKGNSYLSQLHRKKIAAGTISIAIGGLTTKEMQWLTKSVPKGLCLAEFITAIIRDAYMEEKK